MSVRLIKTFFHREFEVKVAELGPGSYKAVGYKDKTLIAEFAGSTIEDVESSIKERLNKCSTSFVSMDEAKKLFLRAFPGGFRDPSYLRQERDYKENAAQFVATQLTENVLSRALENGQFSEVCKSARQAYAKTNLLSPFESARVTECHRKNSNREPFARALYTLLYGDDFAQAIVDMVNVLKPNDAAKWPIVTYFPYLRYPGEHMFLKPEVTKRCADRLGFDLHYDPQPNFVTYSSLLKFAAFVKQGISDLHPRDYIDVQSMIWVIGNENYVEEAESARSRLSD